METVLFQEIVNEEWTEKNLEFKITVLDFSGLTCGDCVHFKYSSAALGDVCIEHSSINPEAENIMIYWTPALKTDEICMDFISKNSKNV